MGLLFPGVLTFVLSVIKYNIHMPPKNIKLKIGVFTDTYYPTVNGVSASTKYYAEELAKFGHHVFIFCPRYSGTGNELSNIARPGVSVLRCPAIPTPTNKEHSVTFPWLGFGLDIRELHMDVIHIQSPFIMGVFGANFARRHDIVLTQTYHTFWEHYLHYFVLPRCITRPLMVRQNTDLCNRARVNFVPSPQMINGLKDYGVISRMVVCPTGVDASRFRREMNKRLAADRLGVPPDKKIILFASRMCKEKSADTVVQTFSHLVKTFPDAVLVMTGDGPFTGGVRKMVRELGLENKFILKGYLSRPDLYAHYAAADIFLFPSVSETQGIVVLEAQLFGTPVVGVRKMGVAMLMKGETGGLLADEKSPEVLAGLCQRLLTDRKLYRRKVKEARANVKDWKMPVFARRMEKHIQWAIRQHQGGKKKQ